MMRSMYSGVSGLRVHQAKMDVIGNNIANVNTVGFKRSAVTFQEVFSQTLKGAGSPQGGRGGTNPQQIGLGVNVASINVNHTKGATQRTDYLTDLMVDGNGYFILANDVNAQNRFYTRAGNFTVDKAGFLVAPNGYKVLDENMKPIQINKSESKAATATSEIKLKGNINYNDSEYTTTVDIYDSLGDVHTLTIEFGEVVDDGNTATKDSYREIVVKDESGTVIFGSESTASTDAADKRYLKFDSNGNYVFDPTGTDSGIFQGAYDTTNSCFIASGTSVKDTATLSFSGAADIKLTFDDKMFLDDNNNVLFTQQSNISDAKGVAVDGNTAGSINDFTISPNGEVVGIFTNGERKTLARIGLADFDNPAGLLKIGGNMFIDSPNSGTPKYGAPSTGSFGDLSPGALEMSNVDLSLEFTDMISTQRGFQANSRIITTTDEMLQELVNLKR
ncbi:flagellar hook protein FlgE [Maledivibacter halophilus]|uniref:Flagellar hook protein FlgE n=1 Tax=Maledivibacter halophilus TaxID=36842 RepID=A0A1T5LEC3_9FIRM|nr:flagellar hook protein FlgE [Maledivibacter halophilus]SKC74396.1 flagellar hook protein FlgE [Maledivibacter halophilus]